MTGIIIGLLAALGIGGGIALSGHGGGGGGNDSGYGEPVQPGQKPSIVSLLASADKYQHVQSVSGYEGPSIGNGIFTVTGERPLVEEGKFKTDESEGEIEDVYVPYTTTIGLENYSHSDAYADYYQKDSFITKGLYNAKEYPDDADNWVEREETTQDILALGGQVLGLKNSEFGYHNNNSLNSLGGELPYYKPFYMYDDTKLTSTARTDTALYKGNVLGYVEAESNTLQETLGTDIHPITGNVNLNIDFANKTLNGNINTKISGQNWYGFNVSGQLNTLNDFSIGSVSIDGSQAPNSALSKYNMTNIMSAGGGGKLLEDETQKELVGKLWLYGNNQDYLIHSDMSFGAIDNSIPPGENPGGDPSQPTQGPIPNYNLISALSDKVQYPDVRFVVPNQYSAPGFLGNQEGYLHPSAELGNNAIILNTVKPVFHNGIFETHFEGGYNGILNFQFDPILLTHNHLISENIYEKLYKESKSWTGKYNTNSGQSSKTVTRTNIIGMGGSKLGLTVSDFGYWDIDSNSIFWNYNREYYYLYMYDNTKLAKNIQRDSAQLKGYLLPRYYKITMDFNFATNRLTGSISNLFDYTGDFYNAGFRIQSLDPSGGGGNGVLLMGKDGLEAVGYIFTANWQYSFGAKEVK